MCFLDTIKHVLSNISNVGEECYLWLIVDMFFFFFFTLWEKIKI